MPRSRSSGLDPVNAQETATADIELITCSLKLSNNIKQILAWNHPRTAQRQLCYHIFTENNINKRSLVHVSVHALLHG